MYERRASLSFYLRKRRYRIQRGNHQVVKAVRATIKYAMVIGRRELREERLDQSQKKSTNQQHILRDRLGQTRMTLSACAPCRRIHAASISLWRSSPTIHPRPVYHGLGAQREQ